MSSQFGKILKVSLFGESHGPAVGAVIDSFPPGEKIDREALSRFMARRAPGRSPLATARKEADLPEILSGLLNDTTTGTPLAAIIRNTDTRPGDYGETGNIPRPGHADYTAQLRYQGFQAKTGGGHFSGRLTAPLVFAGGIAKQILQRKGIFIGAHLSSAGTVRDRAFDPVGLSEEELNSLQEKEFPVLDDLAGERMKQEILNASAQRDSVGGTVECAVLNFPAGYGDPMFEGVENRLAGVLFGIPAVKGVEFGSGFAASEMRGSAHNDPFRMKEGKVVTTTNHHGGILGGITTGMPILFRIALKPTPSIALPQESVDLDRGTDTTLELKGRHDPCIAPRAVPAAEAAAALVMLDILMEVISKGLENREKRIRLER